MAYLSGGADVLPHVEESAEHAVGPHLGDLPEPPIDRQLRVGHSHVFLGTKEMRLMSDSKSALEDRLKLLLEKLFFLFCFVFLNCQFIFLLNSVSVIYKRI